MQTQVPIFVPVLLFVGAGLLLYSFVTFDRLVRAQYEAHREAWIADGQPRGFFWRARECTWFGSAIATHRLSFAWLFNTPAWAAESKTSRALLRRLRISVLLWNVLVVGGVIAFITSLT